MPPHAYPHSPQVAVGAVVFRDDKVLLVKRDQPPGKGLWAIPGGSVRLGETLQEAAEREIREETGITIRAKAPSSTFDVIERDDQGRIRFHYVIVDLDADYLSGEPTAGDDASEARWVTLDHLDKMPVSKHTRQLLQAPGHP
jgi:8-oxo-dGTP diphosphatase